MLGSCGLTSHLAIFKLYRDGTVVHFPNLDLLPGTQRNGQLGVVVVPSLPRPGHRGVQTLPSEGQRAVRVWRESNSDLLIRSSARYLYATMASYDICIFHYSVVLNILLLYTPLIVIDISVIKSFILYHKETRSFSFIFIPYSI